mgnify:CR=1 FL=1
MTEKKETFWDKIKGFFSNVVKWIKGVSQKSDKFITTYAPIAVDVLNWLKDFNASGTADVVETILTNVGKKYGVIFIPIVRTWLTKNLPKIIDSLKLADAIAEKATIQDKIIAGRDAIMVMDSDLKASVLAGVATMLANSFEDDGKLSMSEISAIVAYVYANRTNELL